MSKVPDTAIPSIEDLLVHAERLRALAGRLVSDSNQAEDLVQATWLAAVEQPARSPSNPKGWLARVVHNQARLLVRSRGRREQRERECARPEALPSASELVERATMQREIVDRVLALEENLRTVVLLRFFEDMPPARIAQHLGIPPKTVHSRLARAIAQLRERLDAEHGGRERWCLAIAPLFTDAAATSAAVGNAPFLVAGGWIMNSQAKLGIVAGTLLLGVISAGILHEPVEGTKPIEEHPSALAPALERAATQVELAAQEHRVIAGEDVPQAPSAQPPQPVPADSIRVQGRVVDVRGQAVAGIAIVTLANPADPQAVSASDGSFVVDFVPKSSLLSRYPDSDGVLSAAQPGWITLRQSHVKPSNRAMTHLVVVGPSRRIDCTVTDQSGNPIEAARVAFRGQGQMFQDFPYSLDLSSSVAQSQTTNRAGSCSFSDFPDVPGVVLSASADGFESKTFPLDDWAAPFVFELARSADAEGNFVSGIVFDANGQPVEGALVELSGSKTKSDGYGRFRLGFEYVALEAPLCASVPGRLPGLIPDFGALIESQAGQPAPVELTLGGEPLQIQGKLVDEQGQPCSGWSVQVLDETALSQNQIPVLSAEALARSGSKKVRTDQQGGFTLTGLYPRDYRVQACEEKALIRTEAVLRAGNHEAVLQVVRPPYGPVHGTVLDRHGKPVPNVRVVLAIRTFQSSLGGMSAEGEQTLTAEDGKFAFEQVPLRDVYLGYRGENILPGSFEFPAGRHADAHEIVVALRCHFRVELTDPSRRVDRIEMRDESDQTLQINRFEAHGMSAYSFAQLIEGRTETLSVSDEAVTLVLLHGDLEVERQPIALAAEEVTVLRP